MGPFTNGETLMIHLLNIRWKKIIWLALLLSGLPLSASMAGTIQGQVFLDDNNNGVWDTGEPVRINAIVYIVDEALERAGQGGFFSAITDANGNYWSFGHNTGNFRIWTDIPSGMAQTAPVRGTGDYVFHHVALTSPEQTLTVNFGFFGDQGGVTVNPDESVTVKDSELTMHITPDKNAKTSTDMKVTRKGEQYEGSNTTTTILVQPNSTRAGLRDGKDSFTIVTGKALTDTGEESSLEVTPKPDGSYVLINTEFKTMVTTLSAMGGYTVTDTEAPGMALTINPNGSSMVTDDAFPGMVANLSSEGGTTVTDDAFPGMAATVNGNGSYTVTDKAFPDLVTTVNPDGSYTFIDAEFPTVQVTLETDGNYTVTDTEFQSMVLTVYQDGSYVITDNETGTCVAIDPSRTRRLLSGIENFVKKVWTGFNNIVGKVSGFIAKIASFVGKVAQFVAKVAPYVTKVASGVAAVARFLVPFMPFACKFLCTVALFADKVAVYSDKVAQFANKVADIAGKVEKGATAVAVWATKDEKERRAWRKYAVRRPVVIPADCPTPAIVLLDYVTASASTGHIRLEWATLIEAKNTGFNLWRAKKNEAGEFINLTKVNNSLIPPKDEKGWGASYSFEDYAAVPGVTYYYSIEDVDTEGKSTIHSDATVAVKPLESLTPAACLLYGVQDRGLNDSIFFSLNPTTYQVTQLGDMCNGCDLEAMDAHPETSILYVASGNDSFRHPKGYLYKLDAQTGELVSVGATGFQEISSLAFDSESVLWGWAKDAGLVQLDTQTGQGHLVFGSLAKLADLTWNIASTVLYGSVGTELWSYDPATNTVAKRCDNLPHKTEALEVLPTSILPEGFLLLGSHKNKAMKLQAFQLEGCKMVANKDIPVDFDDIEGLAMPLAACQP
jgi:hypothetical protein